MINLLYSTSFLAVVVGFFFSLSLTYWARRKFSNGVFQDQATSRSLHAGSTPKVGGLGLLPALCLGLSAGHLWDIYITGTPHFALAAVTKFFAWIAPCFIVYIVCLLSDRTKAELPAATRLLSFSVACAIFVSATIHLSTTAALNALSNSLLTFNQLPSMVATLITLGFVALSMLAFTNFFNFMDGMDGLAGSMGAVGFAVFGFCALRASTGAPVGLAALVICASCLGFLFWNWPKAKVFMGDTGSTFLGFSACGLGWLGALDALWHWSLPFLIFFPFWFDATFTLLRRWLRGEKVWRAHREHFYQRAVLSIDEIAIQERHLKVLLPSIGLMVLSSLVALAQHFAWAGLERHQPWLSLLILALVHGAIAVWVEGRYRSFVKRSATSGNFSEDTVAKGLPKAISIKSPKT
jgi:UDP-GlcNAc:undecaprenyl-phosphate/decaprenyl-phosphate GlcNAc-1-phosphate transferase